MANEDEIKSTMSEKDFNELKHEIENNTKAVVEDVIKSNVPSQRLPMSEEDARAKESNGKFKSFGEFAKSVYDKSTGNSDDVRLKALNEGSGEAGGFLVPDEFRAELLSVALSESVVRPRATEIPMASSTIKIPRIKETSRASNVYGGVQGYWVEEAGSYTASEPDFAQFQLTAKKLTGYTQASDELVQDSAIALESLLINLFGNAIRHFEEKAFISGGGAGDPEGILNSDALISVAKETGQSATTVVYENIIKMYSRMLPDSHNNAVWIAHPDVMPQLMQMALNVGTGGSAIFVNNASDGVPMTIFGRPLLLTEHCKSLGTVGDLYYADLSYYYIGTQGGISIASSPHYRFANGETVWRFTERLDGGLLLDSAITPANGSNTISPIVALATRS
jgi:HK97 family phage major capsid protein